MREGSLHTEIEALTKIDVSKQKREVEWKEKEKETTTSKQTYTQYSHIGGTGVLIWRSHRDWEKEDNLTRLFQKAGQ